MGGFMIGLATCVDGRALYYDATLYEFRLERDLVSYADVLELDNHAHLAWYAPEQRDWFRKINPADLDRCNRRALNRHGNGFEQLSPEEQVLADAKRNDSVLAGKIVEADPALVRAVAEALEEQGLVGRATAGMPQMVIGMPQGMEALSQLQKQEGRKMTVGEHFLMRQILKNDDKEKAKREKFEQRRAGKAKARIEKDEEALERRASISRAQKGVARKDREREQEVKRYSKQALGAASDYMQGGVRASEGASLDQALTAAQVNVMQQMQFRQMQAGAPAAQFAAGQGADIVYYDSEGNPIRPELDAMRPSMGQRMYNMSEEERALTEMRERNLAEVWRYQSEATHVPGMEEAGGRRGRGKRNEGASINGHEVNPDGTYKDTKFTKAMSGLGKFNEAIAPLIGGGGGGGMGGGAGGGGMGGGAGGMGGGMGRS